MKNQIKFMIGIFLLAFLIPSNFGTENSIEIVDEVTPSVVKPTYNDAITISGDSELGSSALVSSGDGESLDTAYIIENIIFDLNDQLKSALKISSTEKHLIIRNCEFYECGYFYSTDTIYAGLRIASCSNVTVENCYFQDIQTGICAVNSADLNITSNEIEDCYYGIYWGNEDSVCLNNEITDADKYGMLVTGNGNNEIKGNILENCGVYYYQDYEFDDEITQDNLINGKPLLLIREESGQTYDGNTIEAGQLAFVDCEDLVINNFWINNTAIPLILSNTSNSMIFNNYFDHCADSGLVLYDSDRNIISGNHFIKNSYYQIHIADLCDDNNFTNNIVVGADLVRVRYDTSGNLFWLNDFIATQESRNGWMIQISSEVTAHYNNQGNYWANYEERYESATNDVTTWNTPYTVYTLVDNFPQVHRNSTYSKPVWITTDTEVEFDGSVKLEWNQLADAYYYTIYANGEKISETPGSYSFFYKTDVAGEYEITIIAESSTYGMSEYSDVLTIVVLEEESIPGYDIFLILGIIGLLSLIRFKSIDQKLKK